MDVALLCPLAVGTVSWSAPERTLTVVVKGTFNLAGASPGELAAEQLPLDVEWPRGVATDTEVERPSDFVPRKPKADVFVVGRARAETPAQAIPVYVEVKGVPQRLRKHITAVSDMPALEIPLHSTHLRDAQGAPGRLGPVAGVAGWQAQIDGAFDFARFNTAPADQRLPTVASGCRLMLQGLSGGGATLEMRISPIEPGVYLVPSRAPGAVGRAVKMRADTLFVDVDRGVCTLTWRGETPAPMGLDAYLAVGAQLDAPPSWADIAMQLQHAMWGVAADEDGTLAALGIDEAPPTPVRRAMRPRLNTLEIGDALENAAKAALPFLEPVWVMTDRERAPTDGNADNVGLPFQKPATAPQPATAPEPATAPQQRTASGAIVDAVHEALDDELDDDETTDDTLDIPPERASSASRIPTTVPPPGPPPALATHATDDPVPETMPRPGETMPPPGETMPPPGETMPPPGETIPPPPDTSRTLNFEEGGLRGLLGGVSAMPFLPPAAGSAAPPPVAQEHASRGRRKRTETRELSLSEMSEALAQAEAGTLPFGGATTSDDHTVAEPQAPAPVHLIPAVVPSAPRLPALDPSVEAPSSQRMPASPVAFPIPPAPLSSPGPAQSPHAHAAPPSPQIERVPLALYARILVALEASDAVLTRVLAEHDLEESAWRLGERQMAIDLARDATDGRGALGQNLEQAMAAARAKSKPKEDDNGASPDEDLGRYCVIRAQIEEASDPQRVLARVGFSLEEWVSLRRTWSGRCVEDPELADQVRERVRTERERLRRGPQI